MGSGNDSYTVSLLHMDGDDASTTFTDSAIGGTHTWTASGNAQIDTAQYKFGQSGLFDGTGDKVVSVTSSDWDLGAGNFTVDCWLRFNSLPSNNTGQVLLGRGDFNTTPYGGYNLWIYNNAGSYEVRFGAYKNDGTVDKQIIYSISTPTTGTWYHVAAVRNGTSLYCAWNGTFSSATDVTGLTIYDNSNSMVVGGELAGSPASRTDFNGWLDEVRISKGIARWTTDFSVPTEAYAQDIPIKLIFSGQETPGGANKLIFSGETEVGNDDYTVALLHFDGTDGATTFTDSAHGGTHTWTASGNAQIDTAQYKFGQSGLFDGTGDYIDTPYSADFDFGTGDFTWDMWVRYNALPAPTGAATSFCFFTVARMTDNNNVNTFYLNNTSGAFSYKFVANVGGVAKASYSASITTPVTGVWYHIACVRNGSNFYIFENGVSLTLSVTTAISTNSITPAVNQSTCIGRFGNYTTYDVNGWIDELRISKGIARWTTSFTLPAAPYDVGADWTPNKLIF